MSKLQHSKPTSSFFIKGNPVSSNLHGANLSIESAPNFASFLSKLICFWSEFEANWKLWKVFWNERKPFFFKKRVRKTVRESGKHLCQSLKYRLETCALLYFTLLALLEKSYTVVFREVTGMRFQIMIPNQWKTENVIAIWMHFYLKQCLLELIST